MPARPPRYQSPLIHFIQSIVQSAHSRRGVEILNMPQQMIMKSRELVSARAGCLLRRRATHGIVPRINRTHEFIPIFFQDIPVFRSKWVLLLFLLQIHLSLALVSFVFQVLHMHYLFLFKAECNSEALLL